MDSRKCGEEDVIVCMAGCESLDRCDLVMQCSSVTQEPMEGLQTVMLAQMLSWEEEKGWVKMSKKLGNLHISFSLTSTSP